VVGLPPEVLADTGALVSPGWQDVVARTTEAIDPNGSCLQSLGDTEGTGEIAREQASRKPVCRVIGKRECLLLAAEGLHCQHWTKDLFGHRR
jgi:hypothetical protein